MKIHRYDGAALSADPNDYFEDVTFKIKTSKDKHYSWVAPFVTGYTYNLHWATGTNFEHMAVVPSNFISPNEPGIILRFNYTGNR